MKNKKYKFCRTVITDSDILVETTCWQDDRWELISHGSYTITQLGSIRFLKSPPEIMFVVFNILRKSGGFNDDTMLLDHFKRAMFILRLAHPNNPNYKEVNI